MSATLKFGNGQWATKVGSTLAYNDENGNFKPLPFNFTRSTGGTRVNKDGLIEVVTNNKPRIDFLNDSNGALLLEPTRSNLILNSEKLSLSPIKSGTFTNDFAISPDGTQNATKLTATNLDPYFYQPVSFAAASYTASIYIKGIGNSIGKDFRIVIGTNLSTDLIIPSEWTRFEYTATMSSGSANAGIEIPNPAIVGDEVLIWGWQVEQGSYATSYIPNYGTALGVTRVVETCIQTPSSGVIGQTEGVVYIDFLSVNNFEGSSGILFEIKEDNNNRINIYFSNGTPRLFGVEDSSGVFNQALSLTTGSVCKLAIKYNSTSTKVFINGSLSHTLNGINNIAFNNYSFSPNNNIDYNEIKLYNTALTDAELINLTTI